MAPATAPETMRKALAMGATQRRRSSPTRRSAGSCAVSTTRVLAAALATLEFDLVLAGVDTSDGVAGVVAPGVAALAGLPYLSYAARIEPDPAAGTVRVRRITPTGYDVLEAPMPALITCTQALGEPRYPSLKGIMAARSKEIATLSLADLGLDAATVGGAVATTTVVGSQAAGGPCRDAGRPRAAPTRPPARSSTSSPSGGSSDGAASGSVGETAPRRLARQALDRGRDARPRARARRAARAVSGVVVGADAARPRPRSSPRYLPRSLHVTEPATADRCRRRRSSRSGSPRSSTQHEPTSSCCRRRPGRPRPRGRAVRPDRAGRPRQRDGRALGRRTARSSSTSVVRRQAHHRERLHRRDAASSRSARTS